jgi:hypothetical protein
MFPEDAVEDALHRLSRLEVLLERYLLDTAQATELAEVNVAAGVAHDAMHGVEST